MVFCFSAFFASCSVASAQSCQLKLARAFVVTGLLSGFYFSDGSLFCFRPSSYTPFEGLTTALAY